jgi:hypothetical protein
MTSILLKRQAQARVRSMSVFTAFLIYAMTVMVLFANADEATGMRVLDDHHAATNVYEGIQAAGEAPVDPCEERIQKEVWETFTSQIDSVRQSLEESNQRVHEAEHAHSETQRTLTATVDELTARLSMVEEESATSQASLEESDLQENFLSNQMLKWKTRYEDAQSRFLAVVQERDNFKEAVQILEEGLVTAHDERLQQERATTEQVQAARDEVTEKLSKRLEHLQARNEKLTAERQELAADLTRNKDNLYSTKDQLFDVRQELFRANEKNREMEKRQNAVRDYWLGWYAIIKPAVDEVIQRAQPVYDMAVPIGRQIFDQLTALTNTLFLHLTALWKEFLRSGWPRICQFVIATKETIAPLWARAVTESAPVRASAWAKIEHVGGPMMAYASAVHGQLVERLGSVQKALIQQLGLSMDTVYTFLVLQEGPPRLVSATEFMKEHPEEIIVYIEGTVATLLMAMAVLFFLRRPASRRPALQSTKSKAEKEKVPKTKSKRESRGLKKKLS